MVYPLNISVTKDIVTIFDRKHPLFLSETTSCVYIEKFILASGFKHVKRFLGVFYLRCKILIKSDISMNDCYLNFLVSFRALFSLDVGANLVNSKQTIGIILPDLSLLGYAVPVESFGIGLFVILFAYLIIESDQCRIIKNDHSKQVSMWKDNVISFKDTPLTEVVKVLNRWYNVNFKIEDEQASKYVYTLTSDNTILEKVLQDLEKIAPVKFEYDEVRKEVTVRMKQDGKK